MTEKIIDNIYKIFIPLPKNPLKNLNAYFIKGSEGSNNLLIDTGFNMPECREALLTGLRDLGADIDKTDIFITHLHSDHAGLAPELQTDSTKVYVSSVDEAFLKKDTEAEDWERYDELFAKEGFPRQALKILATKNPARAFAPSKECRFTEVKDGDVLTYGGHTLKCIDASGHTPGQMCLYIESLKLMFLADHVLFDITPNITAWVGTENSLLDYINNLKKFKNYDIQIALPAHRTVDKNVNDRIDEILRHHQARLTEAMKVISDEQGQTAYEIAGKMTWDIRAKSWEDFPLSQQWFATGEVIAHLDYLRAAGAVTLKYDGVILRNYVGKCEFPSVWD